MPARPWRLKRWSQAWARKAESPTWVAIAGTVSPGALAHTMGLRAGAGYAFKGGGFLLGQRSYLECHKLPFNAALEGV